MKTLKFLFALGLFLAIGDLLLQPPFTLAWPKAAIIMCEKFANNSAYGSVMEGECNFWLKRVGNKVCLKNPEEERSTLKNFCVPYSDPVKGKKK